MIKFASIFIISSLQAKNLKTNKFANKFTAKLYKIYKDYWQIWREICKRMGYKTNKFEINLTLEFD